MARAPLIKQILKPILAQNADVVLIERSLVMLPIRHVLRAVTFNYGRYSQRWLDVKTYSVDLVYGQRLYFPPLGGILGLTPPYSKSWERMQPDEMDLLRQALHNDILPFLRTHDDLDRQADALRQGLVRMFGETYTSVWPTMLPNLIARGRLEAARQLAHEQINGKPFDELKRFWRDDDTFAAIRRLCDLLERDDRAGMVEVLHQLEEMTATKSGFAHLWERTPFPLERML